MKEETSRQLIRLVASVPEQINQFTEEEMSHRPDAGKWSKKEILGHLIDSALNNHRRFILAQIETQPYHLIRYAQNDWVSLNHYQDMPTEEIVQLWVTLNQHIIRIINYIPAPTLQYLCVIDGRESVTLGWLIDDYLAHMEHHFRQIFKEVSEAR